MDSSDISRGSDDEAGTGVEDSRAASEDGLPTNGNGGCTLPESDLVGVLEGDEGAGVELGTVQPSERNLAVVETVGESGNLVRCDGLADQPLLRESLNRSQDALCGKGGFGCAHDTVKLGIFGDFLGFEVSNAKGVFVQSQTGDLDVVSDNGPID